MAEMKYHVDYPVKYPFHLHKERIYWCDKYIGKFDVKWDRMVYEERTVHMLFSEKSNAFYYWIVWS